MVNDERVRKAMRARVDVGDVEVIQVRAWIDANSLLVNRRILHARPKLQLNVSTGRVADIT